MDIDEGFRLLCRALGVSEDGPRFAVERLKPGQMVTVILDGEQRTARARATGKRNKRGEHILWYTDRRGRKWRLELPWDFVLLEDEYDI
jgi:hypothetical protein